MDECTQAEARTELKETKEADDDFYLRET